MCGIAGIIACKSENYQNNLTNMVKALKHRGPDDSGVYFFEECALGHARLSIIDLQSGQQPMLTADKIFGITFNGEIYGYKDVRALLDYPFRTTSDTEVMLALYKKYGTKMMNRLPGIFAFALWDDEKKSLFCARDRFGEKPFYYALGQKGEFIFASEIKAIIASGLLRPVLDIQSLVHYMKHLYVHPRETIYKNIYTLAPAHFLHYKDGKFSIQPYWFLPDVSDKVGIHEAVEKFKILFNRSVSNQLISDVPVGAFLSGGLDSSTVVAIASKYKDKIQTFSFRFGDNINELPYAREIADLYKTEHMELSDDETDLGELLIKMQDIYDEPFADSSNIPTYLISKLASQYMKVILTGDGGDELLGGYKWWYNPLCFMKESDRQTNLIYILKLIRKIYNKIGFNLSQKFIYRLQGLEYSKKFKTIEEAHNNQNIYFNDNQLLELGIKDIKDTFIYEFEKHNTPDDAMKMDILNYMPGDILVKIDRASMANGLELRAPFLDVDFASFCISLPFNLKISGDSDKIILQQAFSDLWPESVRKRGKQGFGAPVNEWLGYPSLVRQKNKYLNDKEQKIFSLLSFEKSRKYINYNNYLTWILLVLAIWMDKHEFILEK